MMIDEHHPIELFKWSDIAMVFSLAMVGFVIVAVLIYFGL